MGVDPGTTLRANLEALTPAVRPAIESADAGFVEIHQAGGQTSASVLTAGGRRVRIESRSPVNEAERAVDHLFPDGLPDVVVVIGAGLGHSLEAIERRAAGTTIISIEPFPALARAMLERRDWREWIASARLTLLLGPDYLGIADAARLLGEHTVATIVHPVLAREFPTEIARAHEIAARIVKGAQQNAGARKLFAGRYLLNTLRNTAAIVAEGDVSSLYGLFPSTPAIVVAAGPSLDGNIPQIRAVQDRALIIAVDTTLRPLLAAGIRPHLVVAVDPGEVNAGHLLGIPDTDGLWLVSEGSIDSRVFSEFTGRLFTFQVSNHHPWPWLREQGADRGTLRAWGSVLTTAFDLACVAGCDPIVFVGADLAYSHGLPHCRTTIFDTAQLTTVAERAEEFAAWRRQTGRPTCTEIDIRGEAVLSTPQFVQFRDWLTARSTAIGDRRILNATANGILYGGSIVQADLGSLALPALASGIDLRDRIDSAWRRALDDRRRVWAAITKRFAGSSEPPLPLETWLAFAGANASRDQVCSALDVAFSEVRLVSSMALVADKAAPQAPGTTIVWTATPRGGVAPYAYKWMVHDGDSWAVAQDWSASHTFAWRPSSASTNWLVGVWVRSSGNSAVDGDTSTNLRFIIAGVSALTVVPDKTAPQSMDTTITWTATPSGGEAPHQYKWLVHDGFAWSVVKNWSASAAFAWTPPTANPYWTVGVQVRSKESIDDDGEATADAAFPVTGVAELALAPDRPVPQGPGTAITWTASAKGGRAPHEYKWLIYNGASWEPMTGWVAAQTFVWTPGTTNFEWQVGVWVRSAGNPSNVPEAHAGLPFPITADGESLTEVRLTPDKAAPQRPGTSIRLTATAAGGRAPHEYKWWLHDGTAWTALTDWQASPTFAWTPTTGNAAWQVGVWVRSAGNTVDAREASASVPFTIL